MVVEAKTYEILTTSKFYIEIHVDGSDQRIDGYFMEAQGFERSQDLIEISHVTPQKWGRSGTPVGRVVRSKIPGNSKSTNLTLRRGMTISTAIWDWFSAIEQGDWARQRRDGDLTLYDQGAIERARFRFLGAWPTRYKISELKAGQGEFELEEMELAVEEFRRVK